MGKARHHRESTDTVFGFEHEPVDERPSEFAPTTSYHTVSGYYPSPVRARDRTRAAPRFGMKAMLLSVLTLLGLGGWALHWLVAALRH